MPTIGDITRSYYPLSVPAAYRIWVVEDVIKQGLELGYKLTYEQAADILEEIHDNDSIEISWDLISDITSNYIEKAGNVAECDDDDDDDPWVIADCIVDEYHMAHRPEPFIDEYGEKWDGFEGPIVDSDELSPRHIVDQDKVDRLTMAYLENLVREFHGSILDWNTPTIHAVHEAARKALFNDYNVRIPYAFMEEK